MKRVLNFVTKRKNRDPSQDGSSAFEGSSLGRNSIVSSGASASSSVQQQQQTRFSSNPRARDSSVSSSVLVTKYNLDTKNGHDKSMNKLHVAVWNEDLEKTKKYVRSDQQVRPLLPKLDRFIDNNIFTSLNATVYCIKQST